MNHSSIKYAGFTALAVLVLAFFFYRPTDNWRWDPSFYYAQIRSPIIDGDFNYRDETIPTNGVIRTTAKGLQPSLWPVGPSVLWGPFFLAAHGLMLIFKPAYANGFSTLYLGLVTAGSALLGMIGLLAHYKMCRTISPPGLALFATALALFATPLFFYIFRQPLMAHTTSFLFATLVILACILFEQNKIPLAWSGLILGTAAGIYASQRWSGLLIAIVPLGLLVFRMWEAWKVNNRILVRQAILQLCIFLGVIFLCLTPQFATWHQLHGKWLVNPQTGQSVPFTPIHYLNLFFHTNRGLILWSPLILIGMLSIVLLPLKRLKGLLILYMALYLLPFGFRWDWYGGGGFGPRYFLELLPIASLGIVSLANGLFTRTWEKYAVIVVGLILIFHQFVLMAAVDNMAQVDWLNPEFYNRGRPIGLSFFVATPIKALQRPDLLLGQREPIGNDRQTVFFSLVTGARALKSYAIPAMGVIVLSLGMLGVLALQRYPIDQTLLWVSILLVLHQVGWTIYFLSVHA